MNVRLYKSLSEITIEEWDQYHNGEFAFEYGFLSAMEKSKAEDTEFRYLLISETGLPKAAAILSSFQLHLDLLSGEPLIFRIIKQFFPKSI